MPRECYPIQLLISNELFARTTTVPNYYVFLAVGHRQKQNLRLMVSECEHNFIWEK